MSDDERGDGARDYSVMAGTMRALLDTRPLSEFGIVQWAAAVRACLPDWAAALDAAEARIVALEQDQDRWRRRAETLLAVTREIAPALPSEPAP